MNVSPTVERYYDDMRLAFTATPPPGLTQLADRVIACARDGSTVYTFGNGASAALASHMACDLGKGSACDLGAPDDQPSSLRLRIVALCDNTALMTAYGNDVDYRSVFVEQLKNLLRPGDLAIGISGSGSSPNVIAALRYARAIGATTAGLTGTMASADVIADVSDILVQAPSAMMEQIEDIHVSFHHMIALMLRRALGTAPEGWM